MAKKKPLTKVRVKTVAAASLDDAKGQIPKGLRAMDELKPERKAGGDRAKQQLRLLLASGAKKIRLAAHFFANLEQRLASSASGVTYKQLGFDGWKSFAEHVKKKIIAMATDTRDLAEFKKGMKGRKWWFIGSILFEPYVKHGPVRGFLDETARAALKVINDAVKADGHYAMVDLWNRPIKVTEGFGTPLAGLEFVLETATGKKAFLDFGHIAFTGSGHYVLPTPTEIKLPWAAGRVAGQFSEFLPRLKDAERLLVGFKKSDLKKLKKRVGSGVVRILEGKEGDELVWAEMDLKKLVFDPRGLNQMVVKPSRKEWGEVKRPKGTPDLNIDIGTTAKGGGSFYWKIEVCVNRTPFEKIYEAILLGKN
ncbi:MAG: hypothetical protein CYG60_16970 [Actinobacteria bacterium]|nr:MAG: hypothetical protein CYG60_16970 [Actinomycetota bacterium]